MKLYRYGKYHSNLICRRKFKKIKRKNAYVFEYKNSCSITSVIVKIRNIYDIRKEIYYYFDLDINPNKLYTVCNKRNYKFVNNVLILSGNNVDRKKQSCYIVFDTLSELTKFKLKNT